MSLEGDEIQDAKVILVNLDIICKCVKEGKILNEVWNIILLCDNTGTYSVVVFYVAAFDVLRSHRLKLIGVIPDEAQDGKTKLDSLFYHFKASLRNTSGRPKVLSSLGKSNGICKGYC